METSQASVNHFRSRFPAGGFPQAGRIIARSLSRTIQRDKDFSTVNSSGSERPEQIPALAACRYGFLWFGMLPCLLSR